MPPVADSTDTDLEGAIIRLLDQRKDGATICPSDAARSVAPDDWRPLMEATRAAARRLVESGDVEITQAGRVVEMAAVRGPIRIRRKGGFDQPSPAADGGQGVTA
jgi:hypothetical protein